MLMFLYIVIAFDGGHVPLNSYCDLLVGHNLQSEKNPTVVIALSGSKSQSVESKRCGALDFEVQGPIMRTVIYFKIFCLDSEILQVCQLVLAFTLGAAGVVSWHCHLESIHCGFCCLYLSQQSKLC